MRLAAELRSRQYDVTIFTRAPASPNPEAPEVGVVRVDRGAPTAIARAIRDRIVAGGFSRTIIQYTPRMWDASRLGSPAIPLLAAGIARAMPVTLIAHELYTPWAPRPDKALGAATLRTQLGATMMSCETVFVTTETRRASIEPLVGGMRRSPRLSVLRVGSSATPLPRGSQRSGHALGIFSTLAVGKNFDVVIGAFEQVWRTHPDAELIIVGDLGAPTTASYNRFRARIANSPATDRIRVLGKVSLREAAKAVSQLDGYLFAMDTGANTRSSTLPLPLGAGVPVIALRGPETDALFCHRENVLFADNLDAASFGHAGLELFRDRALRERIAEGGRRLFEEHLSWDKIGDQLVASMREQ
jgi:glycosyltransferase involved in cell wall biosynthesis